MQSSSTQSCCFAQVRALLQLFQRKPPAMIGSPGRTLLASRGGASSQLSVDKQRNGTPDGAGDCGWGTGDTGASHVLPGKLGTPGMLLLSEPRMDKAILEHYKKDLLFGRWGVVGKSLPSPVGEESSLRMRHMWVKFLERVYTTPVGKVVMPDASTVDQFTEVIPGADGNAITLFIAKPKSSQGVPGILHMHGGGMCILSANDPVCRAWRIHLALRGVVAISVEFRNASGKLGCHPYPAGLNDCTSALKWVSARREQSGISKLVLSGESGGGNLCIATALRAKREGRLAEFDGVFAMCPFIAGPSTWRAKSNTSWQECDGYFGDAQTCTLLGSLYDPELKHAGDPCAWPGLATNADLDGLPPHVISVNELDPLRDEGLAYCEKMKVAGVRAESRIVRGTPHWGEVLCLSIEGGHCVLEETIDAMMSFAQSL